MRKKVSGIIATIVLLLAGGVTVYRIWRTPVKPTPEPARATNSSATRREPESRVADARKRSEGIVRAAVEQRGLHYPPREIFLRVFKHEAVVEIWGREAEEPFRLIAKYPVLVSSGAPGPKRREGDLQVPEGFYQIDRFNPESNFHLSLGLNYPNASDRVLSDPEKPGCDIFIHGKAASTGCLPLGDANIEQLFLLALDVRQRGQRDIPVHIFPSRMSGIAWEIFAGEQSARKPALAGFWEQLKPAYALFEREHRLPEITVAPDGSYHVAPGK